jgi:hypothetical protein
VATDRILAEYKIFERFSKFGPLTENQTNTGEKHNQYNHKPRPKVRLHRFVRLNSRGSRKYICVFIR